MGHPVVIFDGYCNFCSRSVLFIIKRDPDAWFRFTASQEPAGKRIVEEYHLGQLAAHSIVLIENETVYRKSTAALRIARKLSGLWPMVYALIVVPKPVRDFFYDMIAGSRYRLFGMRDSCFVPGPELRRRFLDQN